MSQSFKFRYDEMRENNPAESKPKETEGLDADLLYPSGGSVRDICFILPDGSMEALNYAYLVRKHCTVEGDKVVLEFTTHTVTISGVQLKMLFFQLMQQLNKIVACVDERYNNLQEHNSPVVNHITVNTN